MGESAFPLSFSRFISFSVDLGTKEKLLMAKNALKLQYIIMIFSITSIKHAYIKKNRAPHLRKRLHFSSHGSHGQAFLRVNGRARDHLHVFLVARELKGKFLQQDA